MKEANLIKKALAGEEEALAILLQDNYLMTLGYFTKVTQDPELAKDLTQETMVRAIKNLRRFRGDSKFSSWLISIGSNLYRDELRKRRSVENKEIFVSKSALGTDQMGTMKVDIKRALLRLSAEKRMTLALKHFYDYSYAEIAQILKIPIGTVRSDRKSVV